MEPPSGFKHGTPGLRIQQLNHRVIAKDQSHVIQSPNEDPPLGNKTQTLRTCTRYLKVFKKLEQNLGTIQGAAIVSRCSFNYFEEIDIPFCSSCIMIL